MDNDNISKKVLPSYDEIYCMQDLSDDDDDFQTDSDEPNDEEEIDIVLHENGRSKIFRRTSLHSEGSDKQEVESFEEQLNNEIEENFQKYQQSLILKSQQENLASKSPSSTKKTPSKSKESLEGLHSDSSEESSFPNDDEFYDERVDHEDAQFFNALNIDNSSCKSSTTDAILNCPSCMALLCADCQRHEYYKTQYRAMFVFNCEIEANQTILAPLLPEYKSKKRNVSHAEREREDEASPSSSQNRAEDVFKAVVCSVCRTQIAAYDSQSVYHFFNVLASFA